VLVDKLAAMEQVLNAKPIIAGRYSAAPWTHFMLPLAAPFGCAHYVKCTTSRLNGTTAAL